MSIHQVLVNPDLIHYIGSFIKKRPCTIHKICMVNENYKNNYCKLHCNCVSIDYGDFTNGYSLALRADSIELLELFKKQLRFSSGSMDQVAKKGYLNVLKWLHSNKIGQGDIHYFVDVRNAINSAARNGHLNIIEFFHTIGINGFTKSTMDDAAMCGHLDVVKFLHYNRTEGCTKDAIDAAAICGHLQVVKWLCENRTEGFNASIMIYCNKIGKVDISKYLLEQKKF